LDPNLKHQFDRIVGQEERHLAAVHNLSEQLIERLTSIMAQIDDLNANLATLEQSVTDAGTRVAAAVAAGGTGPDLAQAIAQTARIKTQVDAIEPATPVA
jgi:rubrerythrin